MISYNCTLVSVCYFVDRKGVYGYIAHRIVRIV
jgi:hypothetical protein